MLNLLKRIQQINTYLINNWEKVLCVKFSMHVIEIILIQKNMLAESLKLMIKKLFRRLGRKLLL